MTLTDPLSVRSTVSVLIALPSLLVSLQKLIVVNDIRKKLTIINHRRAAVNDSWDAAARGAGTA